MKKIIVTSLALLFLAQFHYAAATPENPDKKGGVGPFLASCCLGPRVGLELNENQQVRTVEWVRLVFSPVGLVWSGSEGWKAAGPGGCLANVCIGPRVGNELKERKIRTKEWLLLVPVVNWVSRAMISIEALNGKTMTEIEEEEKLKKE